MPELLILQPRFVADRWNPCQGQSAAVGLSGTVTFLARRLKRARIAYKRAGRSLKHKQNADVVADKQAQEDSAVL